MRDIQDVFFNERYFTPAMRAGEHAGIQEPLGRAVVYDSFVHGSCASFRGSGRRHTAVAGRARMDPGLRRDTARLARQPRAPRPARDGLSHGRPDAADGAGHLGTRAAAGVPRRRDFTNHALGGSAGILRRPARPGTRDLAFAPSGPLCRGLDVRRVQLALSERGADIRADGMYGRVSAARSRISSRPLVSPPQASPAARLSRHSRRKCRRMPPRRQRRERRPEDARRAIAGRPLPGASWRRRSDLALRSFDFR